MGKGDQLLVLSISPFLTALDVFGSGYAMYMCTVLIKRDISTTN